MKFDSILMSGLALITEGLMAGEDLHYISLNIDFNKLKASTYVYKF